MSIVTTRLELQVMSEASFYIKTLKLGSIFGGMKHQPEICLCSQENQHLSLLLLRIVLD